MRVGVWFDGGGRYGFGNIRRSRELSAALAGAGHEVFLRPVSLEAARLASLHGLPSAESVDVVVLDLPYAGDARLREARSVTNKVVALDYEGDECPDLVVSLQNWRALPPECHAVSGVDYAIIRAEIRNAIERRRSGDDVLIIVGGGDQDGLQSRIVDRLPNRRVCVVEGPAAIGSLPETANITVLRNPSNLPEVMATCAWGITTGGTAMLEMLHLGKAVHVVPRTPAEENFAGFFQRQGALLGMGIESIQEPEYAAIEACEKRGPRLVDGKGCERIIEWIERA